nr:MAG TPA: hypothetical protein [Caudoviricetes sp.]
MLLPVCGLVCGNKSLCSLTIGGKPHNCEGGRNDLSYIHTFPYY